MISIAAAAAGAVVVAVVCMAIGRLSAAWSHAQSSLVGPSTEADALHSVNSRQDAELEPVATLVVDAPAIGIDQLRGSKRALNPRTGSTSFFEPDENVEQMKEANRRLQERLAAIEEELKRKTARAAAKAAEERTDPVTHLADRRAFDEQLAECCAARAAGNDDGSIILMEVDRLQQITHRYGTPAGEFVLNRLAGVVRDTIGSEGVAARYGEVEFGVILPRASVSRSKIIAERIRKNCDVVQDYAGTAISTSVSLGLANCGASPELTLAGVDQALLAAKQAGCNRTFLCDGIEISPVEIAALTTSDGVERRAADDDRRQWFDRRGGSRKGFETAQWLAPFTPGLPIRRESFREVQCRDISLGGFSFVLSEMPDFAEVVVALGAAPNVTYVRAKVVHIEKGSPTPSSFVIGCRFAERLAKAADPVAPV